MHDSRHLKEYRQAEFSMLKIALGTSITKAGKKAWNVRVTCGEIWNVAITDSTLTRELDD